jgi:RNA polymerase sigma-70 factor (ECF subfamily)
LELIHHPASREDGFRQLVMKYQERLYNIVRRKVVSHEDADDVLQNIFLKVFRHIDKFESRSELFTWMYRIAGNEVINHHKQFSRIRTVELNKQDEQHADAYLNTNNLSKTLESVVGELPERQQMVFRMRYFDELSYKQIAEILLVTEGALKASFHHAVKKIEEEFRAKQIL